ncbi:hypothetical protein [Nocardia brasiliensis]|uniref:hypothetical protein n=1 Tax=Nocardia brasiliensis TaxID=37326 RepID=UPI003D8AF593
METQPESNTPPPLPPRRRRNLRPVLNLLDWVRTAVNVYTLLAGNDTASSTIKTITELAARALAAIIGLQN